MTVVQELEKAVAAGKSVHTALAEAERKRRPPSTETEKAAAQEKHRAHEIGSRALAVTGWRRNLLKLALSLPTDQSGGSGNAGQPPKLPPASEPQNSRNRSVKLK